MQTIIPEDFTNIVCPSCLNNHRLVNCVNFLDLDPYDRQKKVKELRLCFNCLSPSHFLKYCTNSSGCKECTKMHHDLLHFPTRNGTEIGLCGTVSNCSAKIEPNEVLLPTLVVNVRSSNGHRLSVRAILDSASQASFISTAMYKRLGFKAWTLAQICVFRLVVLVEAQDR